LPASGATPPTVREVILVDTSVWIGHLRHGDRLLETLLEKNAVLMHPFVLGEIAMGPLHPRDVVLGSLRRLPEMLPVRNNEVFALIESASLFGTGIGFVDAHLLTAVRLTPDARLWTRDRRLAEIAESLSVAARSHDA
jgi:predicted nucleic acid-binding protein